MEKLDSTLKKEKTSKKLDSTLKREKNSNILIKEFEMTNTEVAKLYGVKKQLINKSINTVDNAILLSEDSLDKATLSELELIKKMVIGKKYKLNINNYYIKIINNMYGKYAIILKKENDIKIFFSDYIKDDENWKEINNLVVKNRLNELNEKEQIIIKTGKTKYISGIEFFEPENRNEFLAFKKKRKIIDENEYSDFLVSKKYLPSKYIYTDDKIKEKIKECIATGEFKIEEDGKLYVPPQSWLRSRCDRQEDSTNIHYTFHEFVKLYGYEATNHKYKNNSRKRTLKLKHNIFGKEKEVLSKYRIGQDLFKKKLLKKYENKCCICGLSNSSLLVASHIKTWKNSNPLEKIDVNNGLLLCSLHDALFDKNLITFDDIGNIIISDNLCLKDRKIIGLSDNIKIFLNEKMNYYMNFHRKKLI